jgi:hypothetical protein
MDATLPFVLFGGVVLLLIVLKAIRFDRSIRQFSVRDMLLFVFIYAVWLTQILAAPLATSRDITSFSPHDLVVGFVWMVLAVFYWRRRLRAPLALHAFGPLFLAAGITVFWITDGGRLIIPERCWQLSVGAFMGSLVSLPFAIMILVGLFGRKASGENNAAINEELQRPPSADQPSG